MLTNGIEDEEDRKPLSIKNEEEKQDKDSP
jgi:hypothetical protein